MGENKYIERRQVCNLPWRQTTPSAYAASAGVFLLVVAAGFLAPSLRQLLVLSPATSMSAPPPAFFSGGLHKESPERCGENGSVEKKGERVRSR